MFCIRVGGHRRQNFSLIPFVKGGRRRQVGMNSRRHLCPGLGRRVDRRVDSLDLESLTIPPCVSLAQAAGTAGGSNRWSRC